MSIEKSRVHVLAYMLRMWQISDGEQPVWRASLQDVYTGERLGFADLDEATAYLRRRLDPRSEVEHPGHELGSSTP